MASIDSKLATCKIKVIGVGGGGNNAINRMILSGLEGASFVAVNTDQLVLDCNEAEEKITLGAQLTHGLGAGANPEIGANAALEAKDEIKKMLEGVNMLFITAGMGGGTGTGAAPIIAEMAHELGILTIGIVTKPFSFEGNRRMMNAVSGIEKMKEFVDTLLVIPNEKLLEVYPDIGQNEAYYMADTVLRNAVKGITEIITKPTMINVDFADVQTIMKNAGLAHMGIGEAEGGDEEAVINAVRNAANSPLIETNIAGAKGVILQVIAPPSVTLRQINNATSMVRNVVDPEANIIFGTGQEDDLGDKVKVTLIATGFVGDKSGIIDSSSSTNSQLEQAKTETVSSSRPATISASGPQVQDRAQSAQQPHIAGFSNSQAQSTQTSAQQSNQANNLNSAMANITEEGKLKIDLIMTKIDAYKDPSTPEFLRQSIANQLKGYGIDISKL